MKYLIVLALLVPMWAQAQVQERMCETERVITKEDGRVSEERRVICKDQTKEVFSDCERYQWKTLWGIHNSIACNWKEREAMDAALTHAPNGVKIEWYDVSRNDRGYIVVVWTRPPTQSGLCRDIIRVRYSGNVPETDNYIMCNQGAGRGWQAFKGN